MRVTIKHFHTNGDMIWKDLLGKIHREDGPAIIYADGTEHWYYDNKYLKDVHSVEELIIKLILE